MIYLRSILFLFSISLLSSSYADFNYIDHVQMQSNKLQKHIRDRVGLGGFSRFYQGDYHYSQVVDQILVKGKSKIFIKSGLEVEESKRNKFIKFESGYLYHFSSRGHHFAILLEGTSRPSRQVIIKSLKKSISNLPKFSVLDFIIPKVYAQETNVECSSGFLNVIEEDRLSALTSPANHLQINEILTRATSCVQSVLAGAWGSTGGRVSSIAQGFMSFIKSPIKSSKKMWKTAKETYHSTVHFFKNIKEELTSAMGSLGKLSTEAQIDFVCGLVGSLGGSVLMGMITGGPAGMGRAAVKLAQQIQRFKGMSGGFQILDKVRKSLAAKGQDFKSLVSKIMKSDDEKALKNFQSLGDNELNNLTVKYAMCAFN